MTVDDILADAALLPLLDAAYAVWCAKSTFERLEGRPFESKDLSTPEARQRSMEEIGAQIKYERDFAHEGPTFSRLMRAHPDADDAEARQAIIAAVKFDDDCFKHFSHGSGEDYVKNVERAVARAARGSPRFLETTYRNARNRVAYYMK